MKRLFLAFVASLLLIGCTVSPEDTKKYPSTNREVCNELGVKLTEFTIEGKTHQYVIYSTGKWNNGMCHYPECKYCANLCGEYYSNALNE